MERFLLGLFVHSYVQRRDPVFRLQRVTFGGTVSGESATGTNILLCLQRATVTAEETGLPESE